MAISARRGILVDSGHDENVSRLIFHDRSTAAIPQPPPCAVWRVIENGLLLERSLVVGEKPAMIAMAKSDVDFISHRIQREAQSLIATVFELDRSSIIVPARAGDRACHFHGAAKLF